MQGTCSETGTSKARLSFPTPCTPRCIHISGVAGGQELLPDLPTYKAELLDVNVPDILNRRRRRTSGAIWPFNPTGWPEGRVDSGHVDSGVPRRERERRADCKMLGKPAIWQNSTRSRHSNKGSKSEVPS